MMKIYKNWGLPLVILLMISSTQVQAQALQVSGKITDETGNPIPGVNVLEKGTANGTVTDNDGSYKMQFNSPNAVVVLSFIGYETQEIQVNGKSIIDASLVPSVATLGEIVVVGYGTQKKSSLIGSVASVSSKDISTSATPSIEMAIQGKVPGVIVTNNGSPGSAPLVRIRGIGSINYASNPLYVVDGIPQVGNFTIFDSKDIESAEVLKDAASAAIYGSRASAGVILITTKKGSNDGKIHVTLDSYIGVQSAWKQLSLLNTDQYVAFGTALNNNAGTALPPAFSTLNNPIYAGSTQTFAQTNTDWQKEMFQDAAIQQHQLSISGGTDKSKVYASVGYFKQDGIMLGTGFERINARINSEHKISSKITFGQTFLAAYGFQKLEQQVGGRTQIQSMIRMTPYITVKNPNNVGGYNGTTGADASDPQNPVRAALQDLNQITNVRLLGTLYFNVKLMKWLTYRFNLGIDYNNSRQYQYAPIYSEGFNGRNPGAISDSRTNYIAPVYTNQLTFDKTFDKHSINAVGVIEYQTFRSSTVTAAGNFTSQTVKELAGLTNQTANGTRNEAAIISYVGRLNYEYAGKYLLSASLRRDGASSFAPGHKFGNFPSVGLGWRISEESFMKSVPTVSDLKLRASWGTLGNIVNLMNYPYSAIVQPGTAAVLGGATANGSYYDKLANGNFAWEKTDMTNIGIDLGLLQNKITFTAEWYYRNTSNLILGVPPPPSAGFSQNVDTNIASMTNTGVDIQLGYRESVKELKWGVSGNIGFVQNQVTSLQTQTATFEAGANADFGGYNITNTQAGHPVQSFYGWQTAGIFQTAGDVAASASQPNAKPGDIRFADTNGDGVIDASDRVYLGNVLPNFSYGFNLTANYKGWDFQAFFQGVQGNKIYNGTKVVEQGMLRLFNAGTDVLRAWTPTNTDTDVPRAVNGDPNNNSRTSNRFIEDGSYLRLKNLTIGYSLPDAVLKSISNNSLTKLRIYFQGQNLITVTKYTGYDPEVGFRNNTQLTAGIDYGQFPQARTLLVGIQVGF